MKDDDFSKVEIFKGDEFIEVEYLEVSIYRFQVRVVFLYILWV